MEPRVILHLVGKSSKVQWNLRDTYTNASHSWLTQYLRFVFVAFAFSCSAEVAFKENSNYGALIARR